MFAFIKTMHMCPECSTPLKRLAVKCEDGHWIKVWGCQCAPTIEEVMAWEKDVETLRMVVMGTSAKA